MKAKLVGDHPSQYIKVSVGTRQVAVSKRFTEYPDEYESVLSGVGSVIIEGVPTPEPEPTPVEPVEIPVVVKKKKKGLFKKENY